ncbi:MAG: mandelate racemase/muconate lactonizing enzyme family protein [Bacteroidota bacterium]
MQKNRRNFLKNITLATAGTTLAACNSSMAQTVAKSNQKATAASLLPPSEWQPVTPLSNIKTLLPAPVIIDKIEVIRHNVKKKKYEYMIKVTDKDGDFGLAMGNGRFTNTFTLFQKIVLPFFKKKDVRDAATLFEEFYYFNDKRVYKYLSMPLWNCYGIIESAMLDLLGKKAGKNVRDLLGTTLRKEIPVYMSSTERGTTAEEEVEWLGAATREVNAEAIKFKIGGRMSRNADASPGRTDKIVPLFRKTMGDDVHLYVDSNGSYDVAKSIEIGKWLEAYNIGFYEEPNEWGDFVSLKKINDALDMTVAGGEQDHDWHKWQWMIDNRAMDLIQPDLMYNGGILRTIKLANYAAQKGIPVTTHNPRNNAEYANILAFASVVPNVGPYQEYRAEKPKTQIRYSTDFTPKNGKVKVLDVPGLGVAYDFDFIDGMEVFISSKK